MSEDIITTPAATGTAPTPPADPANSSAFDTTKIADADFDKIFEDPRLFKHDRFKQLNEQAKEAKILKETAQRAAEDKMKADKEFEKLANAKEQEANSWKDKASQAEINSEIVRIAASKGAIDLVAVKKLIDKGNVKIDESDNVTGAEEAVEALMKSSPYLFGKHGGTPNIGTPSSPGDAGNGMKRFKMSQLNDARFFRANAADIDYAMKHGGVDPD